jgi:hypothetical protein
VRSHVGDIKPVSQVTRKKFLSSLIVLSSALRP